MKLNTHEIKENLVRVNRPIVDVGVVGNKYEQLLERQVATCLLWEDTFYKDGDVIAKEIKTLVNDSRVSPEFIAYLAIKARFEFKLRHVPLYLIRELVRQPRARDRQDSLISDTLARIINRPDELGEFMAIYWKDKKEPIAKQVKLGLKKAFGKFTEYQLSKWDRDGKIKLRDVMFLTHPDPCFSEASKFVYRDLANKQLKPADTWEVELSAKGNNSETWVRLISENKLGYMALLQNLRNMTQAGVPTRFVEAAIREKAGKNWALPFRFLTAARINPQFSEALSDSMLRSIDRTIVLGGSTAVVVDVSGSMDAALSSKGETTRIDAACGLAVLVREIGESVRVFSFSSKLVEVPNFRGLGLVQGIKDSQPHGGTATGMALLNLRHRMPDVDRVIVMTDEQDNGHKQIPSWASKQYFINVAPYQKGVDTKGEWVHINGWSERVVDWIQLTELLSALK